MSWLSRMVSLARQRPGADQALGCARSRFCGVSAFQVAILRACLKCDRGRDRDRLCQQSAGSPLRSNPAGGFPLIGPPAIRSVPRTGALVSRTAPASAGKIRFLPREARVPPDFTAPAPCVGSPSGRRSCCALPCSAQPKSMGAFRTVRSVEAFATGGSEEG